MFKLRFITFLAVVALINISCTNKNPKKSAESIDKVIIEESKSLIRDVPAPKAKDVINSLIEAKAGFIFDITNSVENTSKYLTQKQKALNLGIYSADLSYVSVYQKQEEIVAYLKAFTTMATSLKITSINKEFLTRVDNNLSNTDSLNAIIDDAFLNANASLNKNDRSQIAIFILAGSWIEGMFIVEKTMEFAADTKPLWDIIIHNKETLSKLNRIMALDKDNENIKDIYEPMVEIEALFEKLAKDGPNKETREILISKIKDLRYSII